MNESDAHVYDEIRKWVWSGFYSQDEIQEIIEDILEEDCDEAMLRASVASQWQAKQQDEQTWPAQSARNLQAPEQAQTQANPPRAITP